MLSTRPKDNRRFEVNATKILDKLLYEIIANTNEPQVYEVTSGFRDNRRLHENTNSHYRVLLSLSLVGQKDTQLDNNSIQAND